MEIKNIRIPRPQIRDLPPPVIRDTPPPVVNGISPPVIDMPNPVIEYPTIDVPTQQNFEGQLQPQQPQPEEPPTPNRELPPPAGPIVELPVVGEVPLPPVAPLVTAGATAVVAATVTMGATIALNQVKTALEPALKKMTAPKKKKIKIKQKKPVLHYVLNDNEVDIFEYSISGTKLITKTDKVEQYIRDQVEMDSLYEYDNKLIIDESLKDMFTKEGQKRFKKHFCPSKTIVKKLSARFSF